MGRLITLGVLAALALVLALALGASSDSTTPTRPAAVDGTRAPSPAALATPRRAVGDTLPGAVDGVGAAAAVRAARVETRRAEAERAELNRQRLFEATIASLDAAATRAEGEGRVEQAARMRRRIESLRARAARDQSPG